MYIGSSRRCSIAAKTKDERKQRNRTTVALHPSARTAARLFIRKYSLVRSGIDRSGKQRYIRCTRMAMVCVQIKLSAHVSLQFLQRTDFRFSPGHKFSGQPTIQHSIPDRPPLFQRTRAILVKILIKIPDSYTRRDRELYSWHPAQVRLPCAQASPSDCHKQQQRRIFRAKAPGWPRWQTDNCKPEDSGVNASSTYSSNKLEILYLGKILCLCGVRVESTKIFDILILTLVITSV